MTRQVYTQTANKPSLLGKSTDDCYVLALKALAAAEGAAGQSHDVLADLQGGSTGQHYHLTQAERDTVTALVGGGGGGGTLQDAYDAGTSGPSGTSGPTEILLDTSRGGIHIEAVDVDSGNLFAVGGGIGEPGGTYFAVTAEGYVTIGADEPDTSYMLTVGAGAKATGDVSLCGPGDSLGFFGTTPVGQRLLASGEEITASLVCQILVNYGLVGYEIM